MMSLDQSLLTMSSEVGSSGWDMQQPRQDPMTHGCNSECNNDGVHERLVFMVIVTLSLLFLFYSILCFPHLQVGGQAFRGCCCGQETFRWVRREVRHRGVAQGGCCLFCACADLPVPGL